ncbi:MAG TPA: ACP phosphodiesterase [Rhodanobacteraceae bacterium]
MNHLAHALLADTGDAEFALGSALGDFVHGPPDRAWPAARRAGLRFHRAIDHFTDAHPEVVAARRVFAPPMRRYAGIVLDVWFDYLLIRDWQHYVHTESVSAFATRWLALLDAHVVDLPAPYRRFLAYMHAHALPAAYGDPATLSAVFGGLAKRLSHPWPAGAALPALEAHAAALQPHFDRFFPEIVAYATRLRSGAMTP